MGRVGELSSQLATATSDRDRIESQFNVAAQVAPDEKAAHDKTKDALRMANGNVVSLTSERDAANRNVERFEKLCSVRGVDPKQSIAVPEDSTKKIDGNSPAAKWAEYEDLRKKQTNETISFAMR